MTMPVPDFAVGDGRRFRLSASEIAGRDSHFTCPIGLALQARFKTKSLQPNDRDRWRKTWDDAGKLHFAIRDGYQALDDGRSIADIVDGEPSLTHAQRRFFRHALEQLEVCATSRPPTPTCRSSWEAMCSDGPRPWA